MSQLLQAQQEVLQSLKSRETEIKKIRTFEGNLIEKWQAFLGIILPIQMEAIGKFGYEESMDGLQQFNADFLIESANDAELKRINDGKWEFLFNEAFGLKEVRSIDLETARKMINDIATEMISDRFLKKLEDLVGELPSDADIVRKRKELLTLLLPVHMSVMESFGFEGEQGYLQAQRALMDHMADPEIQRKSLEAQRVVFDKLK